MRMGTCGSADGGGMRANSVCIALDRIAWPSRSGLALPCVSCYATPCWPTGRQDEWPDLTVHPCGLRAGQSPRVCGAIAWTPSVCC